LFSAFRIAQEPLSTPVVEKQRQRDGIRKRCGNECATKLRVREIVEVGGRANCRKKLWKRE
jgi:hypothetical protein